jgi:hypothetical protein
MLDPEPDDPPNPYAPPGAPLEPSERPPEPEPSTPEDIRLEGLRRERTVRALGVASFGAAFIVTAGVAFNAIRGRELLEPGVLEQIPYFYRVDYFASAFVVPPLLVVLHILLGRGFLRLEPEARRLQIGLSASILAAFVLNRVLIPNDFTNIWMFKYASFGIAHVATLYFLTERRCARVFSEGYRETVEATPDLKARLGPLVVIGALLWGVAAGWGDDSLAKAIGRHLATRLMGARLEE